MTRGDLTESERTQRLKDARSQIGELESARIVVSLEGVGAVTENAYEVWRAFSEWLKEVRSADPGLLGLEHAESILLSCQQDAERCLEATHLACRVDMTR
ncbi:MULTISPECIES: hypothetical protein [Streptomyces]|uniref:Uncharacterized protein n=1 Tax=Streptomyces evansiae TaxID=3075535 RepID=A0ABU2RAJ0_9ACTN|nr:MULTISPECIES: hypothetical protein [unclassified Streptomyces]MDT0413711.1 hypothetical protein [Streptomyces sp. DSM 41979]MYQ56783.1 hypothetical protein [Streptomyces sp. SID4926]SCE60034.1 hypothetical protein GA0115252_17943 [Streptomyces sp. DfronAA-171]